MKFSHLILSTEYSMVYGTLKLHELFQSGLVEGLQAIAITDANNMFAAVKLAELAQNAGLKALYGARVLVIGSDNKVYPLHLLAKNPTGYKKISYMLGQGFASTLRYKDGLPLYKFTDLSSLKQDVFCLSGGIYGELGQTLLYHPDQVNNILDKYINLFRDSFVIDIHRFLNEQIESLYVSRAIYVAKKYGLITVATGHPCFLYKKDFISHEIKSCIHTKDTLFSHMRRSFSPNQYFHSKDQMINLFLDCPEAIMNTEYIVQNCNVLISPDKLPFFSKFDSTLTKKETEELFIQKSLQGFETKLGNLNESEKSLYMQRFHKELRVLRIKGYIDYFLIVLDVISWAQRNDIPVGPGRGSGAGSLLAFCLNITDIDPIQHNLLFERFMNLERNSLPDFDNDICIYRREEVIKYVKEKYGYHRVAQIISYSSLAARAVTKDVCRVLGKGFKESNLLTSLMISKAGTALQTSIDASPELKKLISGDYMTKQIFQHCLALEGSIRGATRHAAGIIISHADVVGMGTYCGEDDKDHIVIQWDKDDLENLGFLKFDFLGLRTLTMIDLAKNQIIKQNATNLQFNHLDHLDDPQVFSLINSARTNGVFQLESKGMQKFLKQAKVESFEDIVLVISIFRPGPMNSGMLSSYIDIKNNIIHPISLHARLDESLKNTYGLLIYQEQIMATARVLSGFTLGQGDSLQRAISKKKKGVIESYRKAFLNGALKNEVNIETAEKIFSIIQEFAQYGFNKSHASAYGLITYRTAYLKTYFPSIFYCSHLSVDIADNAKVLKYLLSAKEDSIIVLGPCVNNSYEKFTYIDDKHMRYGLTCIKGIGHSHCQQILTARGSKDFKNIEDFLYRVFNDKRSVRLCQSLIYAGALDCFNLSRAYLLAYLEYGFDLAKYISKQNMSILEGKKFKGNKPNLPHYLVDYQYDFISVLELFKEEQKRLGIVCSIDVISFMKRWLSILSCLPLTSIQDSSYNYQRLYRYAGSLLDISVFKDNTIYLINSGKSYAEVRMVNKSLDLNIEVGDLLIIESTKPAAIGKYNDTLTIYASRIMKIEEAINSYVVKQIITVTEDTCILFTKILSRFRSDYLTKDENSSFRNVNTEIRVHLNTGKEIVINTVLHIDVYSLNQQLYGICEIAYIFTS